MVGGRPRKTQEELDQEMEDYWGQKGDDTAVNGQTKVFPNASAAIPEDEDVDMIT